MRFLQQENYLKLSKSKAKSTYIKTIKSITNINGEIDNQSTKKIIDIKTESIDSNNFEMKINSKLIDISLDSKFKKQEQLSKAINEISSKVCLELNTKSDFITILNHTEIVSKWNILKKELLKKYTGNTIESYFESLSRRIENHDSLLKNFKQLRGFGLLWMMPFGNYSNDEVFKQNRIIDNMISNLPLSFDEQIQSKGLVNNELIFSIHGDLSSNQEYPNKIKNYFIRQNLSDQSSLKLETYSGVAKYDIDTGLINAIEFNITTSYGTEYKKEQHYNLIKHL